MAENLEAPTWTFGDRLRKARRSRRLSQREFARLLGESEKSIANWEGDVAKPRDVVALAKKVEATYGVPAEWLLGVGTTTSGWSNDSQWVVDVLDEPALAA
jgi:transcriptional regulator with XRE-family HTH domain